MPINTCDHENFKDAVIKELQKKRDQSEKDYNYLKAALDLLQGNIQGRVDEGKYKKAMIALSNPSGPQGLIDSEGTFRLLGDPSGVELRKIKVVLKTKPAYFFSLGRRAGLSDKAADYFSYLNELAVEFCVTTDGAIVGARILTNFNPR